jgi:carbon storage regulator
MLVLSRQVGEKIVIDGNITVTVVSVNRNTIRLGISAPDHVVIDRAEVHQRRFVGSEEAAPAAESFGIASCD